MATVLLVDDHQQNIYLLDVLLKTNGFQCESASNGQEALDKARAQPPDLIVTDILMPVMDGFSLCRVCKQEDQLRDIPIIFYTATYTDPKDEAFALSLGASAFLTKPMEPNMFLAEVQKVMAQKELPVPQKSHGTTENDTEYYRSYSETLIRKLEQKLTQLEVAKRRISAFYQVSCNMVIFREPVDLIHYFLKSVIETDIYQKAAYYEFIPHDNLFQFFTQFGFQGEAVIAKLQSISYPSGETMGIVGRVGQTGEGKIIANVQSDENWVELDPDIRSAIYVPLSYQDARLGVLAFFTDQADQFADEDLHNLQILANCLAVSIANRTADARLASLNQELERRVADRTTQLELANRELEAFSYTVSHDLRAPLRGIDGWSQILLNENGGQLSESAQESLNYIRSETLRMGRMIENLLQLSRITRTEPKKVKVDLSSLAHSIVTRLMRDDPHESTRIIIEPGIVAIGDPDLLDIALTNLLGNAWKFSSKKDHPLIEFGVMPSENGRHYFVRDNGVGFNVERAEKLFGAFQRFHRESDFPGTGIGLATVQRIILKHGGRIWAESDVGSGATFYFTLAA